MTHPKAALERARDDLAPYLKRECFADSAAGMMASVYAQELFDAVTAALLDEKQGVEVTEATAMRVLWDAGYKIHGQFGWVQDGRKEFDEKLNSLYAKSVEGGKEEGC